MGPSNPHWTETYGKNKVSDKSLVFWGLLTANCVYPVIIELLITRHSQNTTELEFIKLELEPVNGERLDAVIMRM